MLIGPGQNLVTLKLPAPVRPATLNVHVPGCEPGGYVESALLTEWRPGAPALTQPAGSGALNRSCETRLQGFSGQQLHIAYRPWDPALRALGWMVLQPGDNRIELKRQMAKPP